MQLLTFLTLLDGILTVALMIPLIFFFGLVGVVWAGLIPALIIEGIVFPIAICRVIEARAMDYFRAAYIRPCILGGLLTPPLLWLHHAIPVHQSWFMLGICGVLAGIIALPLLLSIGLDTDERRRLVMQPLRRIGGWWDTKKCAHVRT